MYYMYNSLEPEPKFQAPAPPSEKFLALAQAIQNCLGSGSTACLQSRAAYIFSLLYWKV